MHLLVTILHNQTDRTINSTKIHSSEGIFPSFTQKHNNELSKIQKTVILLKPLLKYSQASNIVNHSHHDNTVITFLQHSILKTLNFV